MRRSSEKKRNAVIIGIGNILLKDEGAGVRAVEAFNDRYSLPRGLRCVDGGTAGLKLLSLIKDSSHVIIVDAVRTKGAPGAVSIIRGHDIPEARSIGSSVHRIGVSDLMALARFEGCAPDIVIIGIKPKDISPGLTLTPVIRKKIPEAVMAIKDELERKGIPVKEKPAHKRKDA
ncbi:MAG: HyaD/HybD family hydrogenase maturation endopeptidase [Deltaproteobacteria bacterium]|nr:HyaD/HybD family hydrogenase maturation endopeptidase [Deltaproteobacteria bacterium]